MKASKRLKRGLGSLAGREHGGAMIEFALLLPILMVLFAGATEIGRLFYTYTTLAKATKVGARYLSVQQTVATTDTNAKNLVLCGDASGCYCTGAGCSDDATKPKPIVKNLLPANISITAPATDPTLPRYVTVQITGYTYQPWVFNLARMTGAPANQFNVSLTPSTRMRYMR